MEIQHLSSATGTRREPRRALALAVHCRVSLRPAGRPPRLAVSWRHWWQEPPAAALARAGLSLDASKAALCFEGYRRRDALHARRLPEGWQTFTGLAWAWQTESWADLHSDQQARLLAEIRKPTFTAPAGYTTFPEDTRDAQRAAALTLLQLPADDDCDAAVQFVRRARTLERAGLTLAAVDTRTRQATRYAADALAARPLTVRVEDLGAPVTKKFRFVAITAQFEAFDTKGTPSDFVARLRL